MTQLNRTVTRRPIAGDPDKLPEVPTLLARLYAARGVTGPEDLNLGFSSLLSPDLLAGMSAAVQRLEQALECDERILIVGDFDADGATSTAMAVGALREFGATQVDYLVPNRFEFGYGLTPGIVALAAHRKPDLIITVDNGISSIEGVAAAGAAGIEVLVTDHHLPGDELPDAAVILNPNQRACGFPSKALAGVGVMFYLLLGLRKHLRGQDWFSKRQQSEPHLAAYLDLVALGTVADVVPLDHNNRILVNGGLQRMRSGRARPGVEALLAVAGRDVTEVVASDLGFAAGPRLNAAGRLDDMSLGIECLLATDASRARSLALQLDSLNRERQQIERDMEHDALKLLSTLDIDAARLPPALVLYEPQWHQGVVGILASRIKDRYNRPVIAFADTGDGQLKGSGRSVSGLHMRDLLDTVAARNPGVISRFGGHAMAAGLSLDRDQLSRFTEAFSLEAQRAGSDSLEAVIETDGELALEEFDLKLAEALRIAGPWGQHFPEPLFDGHFQLLTQRIVGERHLKMSVRCADGSPALDAIAFRVDPDVWPDPTVSSVHLVFRLDVNQFRGERRLQLLVEQLTPI
ncbi:MAG: single-stranded-DNA-specific exonuclease RecJ [Congregibacter sp.]